MFILEGIEINTYNSKLFNDCERLEETEKNTRKLRKFEESILKEFNKIFNDATKENGFEFYKGAKHIRHKTGFYLGKDKEVFLCEYTLNKQKPYFVTTQKEEDEQLNKYFIVQNKKAAKAVEKYKKRQEENKK